MRTVIIFKNAFLILRSIPVGHHIDTKDYSTSIVNFASNVSISVVKSKIYVWEGGISRASRQTANIKLLDCLPRI